MYCPNCGKEITQIVNFCPFCGYSLQTASDTALTVTDNISAVSDTGNYALVLVSCGTCSTEITSDLMEDIFGYTDSYAKSLIKEAPVEIGQNMTLQEASYVAQVFTEYGIEVTVADADETYVDLSKNAVSTVFNSDGSLIAAAAAVIGALSIANRVTTYRKHKKPSLISRVFRTLFTPKPPVHVRRFRPAPKMEVRKPRRIIHSPMQDYRNAGEHVRRADTGHRGGPNGRMGGMKKGRM